MDQAGKVWGGREMGVRVEGGGVGGVGGWKAGGREGSGSAFAPHPCAFPLSQHLLGKAGRATAETGDISRCDVNIQQ